MASSEPRVRARPLSSASSSGSTIPLEGKVTLDGHDVRSLRLGSLRGAISLVSQTTTLFPGTVRDNVLYGRPNASEEEMVEAARIAEAIGFIDELPEGWDTNIGEDGHRLSGGQRQRIAIARAVLKDAPVLVLDEATSNVDNETEAALQRSIERISRDRTTLIIAHRLSTVRNADTIAVMERGDYGDGKPRRASIPGRPVCKALGRSDRGGIRMSDEGNIPRLNNLAESLGMEITDFSEGSCVVELTVGEKHLNMGGMAHGGVHATLLDTSMGGTLVSADLQGRVVRHGTTRHILPECRKPGRPPCGYCRGRQERQEHRSRRGEASHWRWETSCHCEGDMGHLGN